ncbi:Ig-like domain-containing protein [Bdellovibrio sp. ArHS]|uniref:Ig-like domain-containing protein n=1 Tax=Bdellovibrio sp. ArHS TaxID=1569284 RepID=UPI0025BADFEE|nr:Ig-like domain-containing protein [Bdellovibrio sp. ArHS]
MNIDNVATFPISGLCPMGATQVVLAVADSDPLIETVLPCVEGVFSGHVDLSTLPEGPCVLLFTADNGRSRSWVVTKDTTPPLVQLDVLVSYINLDNVENFFVSGTCSESGQFVYIEGGLLRWPILCGGGSFGINLNLVSLADGVVNLSAQLADVSGNESTHSRSTQKDTIRPDVAQLASLPTSPSPQIYLSSSVAGVDVKQYAYKVGPASSVTCSDIATGYGIWENVENVLAADISGLADTLLKLCVWSKDVAGNRQAAEDIYEYTWQKDSSIAMATISDFVPAGIVSNSGVDRTVTIGGPSITHYKAVVLHNQSTCTGANFTSAPEAAISTSYTFSIAADGTYLVCALGKNVAGHWQSEFSATASNLLVVDRVPPSLVLTSTAGSTFNTPTMSVTATFSENVAGFTLSDISVTNGVASEWVGSGTTYSFTVAPSGQGPILVSVGAAVVTDAAGNANVAAANLLRIYDSVSPMLSLSSSAATEFNTSTMTVTATFSEDVTGFALDDVSVTNGIASMLSGSGAIYNFVVTPLGQGSVTVAISDRIALDAGGNENAAATDLTRIYDSVAPTITGLSDDGTWRTSKTWNWSCSETCTFRHLVDMSAVSTPATSFSSTTTATQSSGSGTYYLHVQAQDSAGNSSLVHVSAKIDSVAPAAPSALVDQSYLSSLTASPVVTFISGSDSESGLNRHEARIVKLADGTPLTSWENFTTGGSFSGLPLANNTAYAVEVRAVDNTGNVSSIVQGDGWIADTTAPTTPADLLAGAVPDKLTETPPLSWTASTDAGGAGVAYYEVKIFRTSDDVSMSSWTPLASGSAVTGLSLDLNTSYYFKVRAFDNAGNMSGESAARLWTSMNDPCPANYILVPAMAGYANQNFCVAKYEIKNIGGVPTSQASGAPWTSILRGESGGGGAWKACRDLGSKYDLISNAQWQAIARNIVMVNANWSGGSVGSGSLNTGHSDDSPSASLAADTDDNNACAGTGQSCSSSVWNLQRRTHVLSNGRVIWDFAGNVAEWIRDDYLSMGWNPVLPETAAWTELSTLSPTNQAILGSANGAWNSAQGLGMVIPLSNGQNGVLRGGCWWNGTSLAGVFFAHLGWPNISGWEGTNIGFRCVYVP